MTLSFQCSVAGITTAVFHPFIAKADTSISSINIVTFFKMGTYHQPLALSYISPCSVHMKAAPLRSWDAPIKAAIFETW